LRRHVLTMERNIRFASPGMYMVLLASFVGCASNHDSDDNTAASASGLSQAPTPRTIHWGPCPEDILSPNVPMPPGMECGTLQVPLDYRNPGGRKIEIGISRLASKNPSKRRGVLLTNPGGPAPGMDYPAFLVSVGLPQSIQDRYDVIGVDPRGMGRSTPVKC